MSAPDGQFSGAEIAMSFFTAWVIGASSAFGVGMLFSNGKMNVQGAIGVAFAGLVVAAKDYRSLKRLPTVSNGNTDLIPKPQPQTENKTS